MADDQQPLDSTKTLTERLDINFALQAAGLGVWEINPTTNQIVWDARCQALVGLVDQNQLPFQEALQYIHPDDIDRIIASIEWATKVESGGFFDETYRTIGADQGRLRGVRFWGQSYFTPAGELYRFSGVAQEVTQQMLDKQQLLDQQAQLRSIVQQTPAPTLVLRGDDYRIDQINRPMLAFMGRGEDVLGQPFLSVMPELEGQFAWKQVQRVYQEGVDVDLPEVLVPHLRHGVLEDVYYNVAYRPLREGGQITGMIQVAIDVTEQVKTRQHLQNSESRFEDLVTATPAATAVFAGRDMLIQQVNAPMLAIWGKDASVIGKTLHVAMPELEEQPFLAQLQHVFDTGEPFSHAEGVAEVIENGQRKRVWFNHAYKPLYDQDGQIYGVINTATDVTAQVIAHQKLEESELFARTLFERSPIAKAVFVGQDMVIRTANNNMLSMWGKTPAVVGQPFMEAVPELISTPQLERLRQVLNTGESFYQAEERFDLVRYGAPYTGYYEYTYEVLRSTSGEVYGVICVANEVTQQVIARQKIETNEQLLRNLVLGAPIGISILNADDLVIETVNDTFVNVVGKPYEQLVGQSYWIPFAEAVPYYAEALARVVQIGEPFIVNEMELMLIRHGNEEIVYVTFVYMPITDAAGKVEKVAVWVLSSTQQVVQRREVEQQVEARTQELHAANEELQATNEEYTAINEELEEANRLLARSNENLLKFAYVASHDLQEPLRKIQQFGDLLRAQYGPHGGVGMDYLERMQLAASRMSTLIKDLLSFSRISTQRNTNVPVPLNQIVDDTLNTLELVIAETGAIVTVDPLPTISGDSTQLGQLFQNLLSNALKFRRPGIPPVLTVRASVVAVDNLPLSIRPVRGARRYHQIDVADNGIGFEEKYLDRIFEVFQRLHGRNEFAGTGIGLAICEKVVANHGGAITASSQPGEGATFSMYLPV